MNVNTRSILQELSDMSINKNPAQVIENRGSNLIESTINLLNLIREQYDAETAMYLERRFLNAIKSGDTIRFKRGIKRVNEGKTK